MGLWVFMFLSGLLIPLTMLFFGWRFQKHPPEDINRIYGYRTARSMKNADTWQVAHVCCGKLWLRLGAALMLLTAVAFALLYGAAMQTVAFFGLGAMLAQAFVLVCSVIPVERKLKKTFDDYGFYQEGRDH